MKISDDLKEILTNTAVSFFVMVLCVAIIVLAVNTL
jgi:hypothetical protein